MKLDEIEETESNESEETESDEDVILAIRHLINIIEPDNYSDVFRELRICMFGDRKCLGEPGYVEDPTDELETAKVITAVETILHNVVDKQTDAEFYARLCGNIIRLELMMKGLQPILKNCW